MVRRIKSILISGLWVPPVVLALYVLAEDESYFSVLHWRIQQDHNYLVPLLGIFYFAYPVLVGLVGLIFLAVEWSELKAENVRLRPLLTLSGLCLISGVWLYPLIFIVAMTCFPFRLPL